ncbi:MAG: 50S ribosomal protein L23 [Candidatus Yonathbacteria bacterium]|nr:50S ribosomal protein L23 [Candidatus Yonathbacteria bacterium]
MSIFKKTTKTSSSKTVENKKKTESSPAVIKNAVLVRPYIKEKSAILADEKGTYVFEIAPRTNKTEVAKAVASIYGVNPVRVNIINLPSARVFKRGKNGVKAGTRKALVTLEKGEKIEFM